MNISEPTLEEVKDVVKKTKTASAPRPNAIPYKVNMMCPLILKRSVRLLKVDEAPEKVWRKGVFQIHGRRLKEYLNQTNRIPRWSTLQNDLVAQSRGGGEIFCAVLAKRLTSFLTDKSYIDTSVQTGGVPGISGCVEHNSAITQVNRKAKEGRKDNTVACLDLANAYGSNPHQLIYKALQHYHEDGHIQKSITSYLDGIQLGLLLETG